MATSGQPGPGNIPGDKGAPFAEGRHPIRQPSRWRRNLVLLVIVVAGAWLAWAWSGLREKALVATSFAARTGCVCRFVSQRSIDSCEGDLKSAGLSGVAGLVSLSEDAATRTLRASVPLLARQSADYRADRGCRLEPWRD